jgi:hypothetical protein
LPPPMRASCGWALFICGALALAGRGEALDCPKGDGGALCSGHGTCDSDTGVCQCTNYLPSLNQATGMDRGSPPYCGTSCDITGVLTPSPSGGFYKEHKMGGCGELPCGERCSGYLFARLASAGNTDRSSESNPMTCSLYEESSNGVMCSTRCMCAKQLWVFYYYHPM